MSLHLQTVSRGDKETTLITLIINIHDQHNSIWNAYKLYLHNL